MVEIVPKFIVTSSPFKELTKKQKMNFLNRMDFVSKINSRFNRGLRLQKGNRTYMDASLPSRASGSNCLR